MSIFKSLILSLVASVSLVSGEDSGWYPIEKQPKMEEEGMERDPSIWVLYTKTIDIEKVLVRLPEDPTTAELESGELTIRSERDGEVYELIVSKAATKSEPQADLLYEEEGRWVHVHVIHSEQHAYTFRTTAKMPNSQNHKDFVSSFLIL